MESHGCQKDADSQQEEKGAASGANRTEARSTRRRVLPLLLIHSQRPCCQLNDPFILISWNLPTVITFAISPARPYFWKVQYIFSTCGLWFESYHLYCHFQGGSERLSTYFYEKRSSFNLSTAYGTLSNAESFPIGKRSSWGANRYTPPSPLPQT